MTPEIITALGGAIAAVAAAFVGGKSGGANSLNGFKDEVRTNFQGVHAKLDTLEENGTRREVRLETLEKIKHECPLLKEDASV